MNILIVTRHNGMVKWLEENGITGKVIPDARPEDVLGKDVIGALPLNLASLTRTLTVIDLPYLPFSMRGRDLNAEQMREYGAKLKTYRVQYIGEYEHEK